jgi:hypothetical protein
LIDDYNNDPSQWEVVRTEVGASTNRGNQGGSSVQELLRHKMTGEEMVRHAIFRANGKVFRPPHFREAWK